MKVPYEKALTWLLVEGKDEHFLSQQMDEITLPLPESDQLEELQEQAKALPLSPALLRRISQNKYEQADHLVLQKLGYEEAYLKTVQAEALLPGLSSLWIEVYQLLRNPVARTAVDVGILCKYALSDLCPMVSATFQEPITEAGLNLYQKYFFDTSSMAKFDWRAYLKLCAGIPYLYIRLHAALTKPRKEAMHLAGLPSKAAFAEFLKTVLATAEYKFEYYSRHGNQGSDNHARQWAKAGFNAGVLYEKFSASDVTDFSKSVQTSFAYEEDDVETISGDLLSEVRPASTTESKTEAPALPVVQPEHEV